MNLGEKKLNRQKLALLVGTWEDQRPILSTQPLPEDYLKTFLATYAHQPQNKLLFSTIIQNPFLPAAAIQQLINDNQSHRWLRYEPELAHLEYHPNNPEFTNLFLRQLHEGCLHPMFSAYAYQKLSAWEMLMKKHTVLSGSYLAELLISKRMSTKGVDASDCDFYLTSLAGANELLQLMRQHCSWLDLDEYHLSQVDWEMTPQGVKVRDLPVHGQLMGFLNDWNVNLSNNSLTIFLPNLPRIQIIFKFCQQNFTQTVQHFDFAHCRAWLDLATGHLQFPTDPAHLAATLSRTLLFLGGPLPLSALQRAFKFHKRGWRLPQTQLLKIVLHLQTINFTDPRQLKTNWENFYTSQNYPEIHELPDEPHLSREELLKILDSLTYGQK